jgi:hypothetical protein
MIKRQTYVDPKQAHLYIRVPDHLWYTANHYTRVPSIDPEYPGYREDGSIFWEDVVWLEESILDPSGAIRKPEWIYVLVNISMPGIVKIGLTTTSVDQRVKEINSSTGVPTPWIPTYKFKCYGSRYLEKELHEHFSQQRVSENREMFNIDTLTAQMAIEKLGIPYANALYVFGANLENENKNNIL